MRRCRSSTWSDRARCSFRLSSFEVQCKSLRASSTKFFGKSVESHFMSSPKQKVIQIITENNLRRDPHIFRSSLHSNFCIPISLGCTLSISTRGRRFVCLGDCSAHPPVPRPSQLKIIYFRVFRGWYETCRWVQLRGLLVARCLLLRQGTRSPCLCNGKEQKLPLDIIFYLYRRDDRKPHRAAMRVALVRRANGCRFRQPSVCSAHLRKCRNWQRRSARRRHPPAWRSTS